MMDKWGLVVLFFLLYLTTKERNNKCVKTTLLGTVIATQ